MERSEATRILKHYVDTAVTRSEKNIVNFSAEAKSSKEVSDGETKVYPNTVSKTVVFETIDDNEFKTITVNPSAGTISLANGSISGISDSVGNDSTVALSQCALIDVLEQIDNKADKDHTHVKCYNTIDDMIADWNNIPDNTIATLFNILIKDTPHPTLFSFCIISNNSITLLTLDRLLCLGFFFNLSFLTLGR